MTPRSMQPHLSRRRLLGVGGLTMLAACRNRDGEAVATTSVATSATSVPSETSTTTTQAAPSDYFPPAHGAGEWETIAPTDAGLTDAGLAALVELVAGANSQSFVLLRDGRIVTEQYWAGADADTTKDIASCQKSVTSTLVGIARGLGLLTLEDTVTEWLGSGWSAAPADTEATITVQHLLTMTSGLDERTLTVTAAPGDRWEYNTNAYQKLRRVLEVASGVTIEELTDEWLFTPIGANPAAVWAQRGPLQDPVGDPLWGLNLTVRDMARVGLLAMRDGAWAGTRLVPDGWFAEAWSSIPQKRDYGYLWWLVGKGGLARLGIPPDTVAALGAQDQKIYVIPSAGVVMCRQGEAAGRVTAAESDFDAALLAALLAARA